MEADGRDSDALAAAARGADAVFYGLNPIYTAWRSELPALGSALIRTARASGGLLLFPGNVYNFGAGMPERLTPTTTPRPTNHKGALRVALEDRLAEAARAGDFKLAMLRAGDFFGGPGRGTWLDQAIAAKADRGIFTAPGPMDLVHAFAYLPDLAAAFERVAAVRDRLGTVESFHFEGHSATLGDLHGAMERALGRPLNVQRLPWWAIRLAGLVRPMMRDLAEMRYLWTVPHRLVDPRLEAVAGPLPATPLDRAVAAALSEMGLQPLSTTMVPLSAAA